MDTTEVIPTFSSEEERTKFINGDRQKRIILDTSDVEDILRDLHKETLCANNNLDELTSFYFLLGDLIRSYDVGDVGVLDYGEDKLFFEEVPNPNAEGDYKYDTTFWRIGYCKIGSSRHLAAFKYKENPIDGSKPQYERIENPIRLTHAPREVRIQAAHRIRALLLLILENVRYHKNVSESAAERINPLRECVLSHINVEVA